MLLIDGIKYELWMPLSEDEFEQVVKEHAEEVFGEQSIYLDLKQKLKSKSGIGSIPDGYVIVPGVSPCWHIVEMELSSHPLYEHIVQQVSKFINGIKNFNTQREIVNAIYEEINKDDFLKSKVKRAIGSTETYKFLSDLISRTPVATIIIEKHTEGLDEALDALAHPQKNIIEFQTFVREGADLSIHAHLFEPLYLMNYPPSFIPRRFSPSSEHSLVTTKFEDLKATPQKHYRQPILEALVEMGGQGRVRDILAKVRAKVADKLNQKDYERLPSGEIRWENWAKWERKRMVQEELLRDDSPVGIWEVTEKGRDWIGTNS